MALSTRFLHRLPLISFSLYRSPPAFVIIRKCQSQRRMCTLRSQNARFLHASSGENELSIRMKIQARTMEEVAEDGDGGEEPPENGALFERPLDERIMAVELHKEATESYLSYAMSVLLGRALPDVRDGLKPVHRRILFAMHELGLFSRRPYKKCARVVGEVLGKFHPHGDTAVYDSLVRMAQGFSLRTPLISGHGNFGSVDADPPAAMRYTEARLEAFSEASLLADLEFDTVDFVANFDGSQKEPSVLPSRLPNVLLNGSSGIAVGMATNIPPHNLGEVTDALVALIHNPAATVQQLMEYMPGPDFPTGGKIMGDVGILEAYRTGRGSLILRGKTKVEVLNKKANLSALIITELPYQTNKAVLVEKIAQLVDDKELEGISSIRDESDRTGMRVVLELKRGSEPSIVLNNLYKSTALQSSFSCNMIGLLDGRPKLMGLKDMLQAFLDFRCSVVERRAKFLLRVAEERDHIVKGILVGLGNLDQIIDLIRESKSHSETITALKEGYNLSEKQAEAILNITLRKLTSLERTKFIEEHKSLTGDITNLLELLGDRNRILQVIEKEALELKNKFGTPRRSVLEEGASAELDEIDVIPNEEVLLALSKKGYVKRMKPDTFNLQHRGTVGKSLGKLRQDDSMSEFVICHAHDHVLYFSDKGTVYAGRAFRVPECSRTAAGTPLVRILSLSPEEKITSIIPVSEFREDQYLVMLTAKGYIKRVSLDVFSHIRSSGIIAIQLVPGDELKWARCCAEGDIIVVGSQNGKLVLSYSEMLRKTSRTSRGSISMRLKGEDKVSSMDIVPVSSQQKLHDILQSSEYQGKNISAPWLLLVSENGYGKRVPLSSFRASSFRRVGVMGYKGMIDAVAICGAGFKAPTEYELSGPLLLDMVEEMKLELEDHKKIWSQKGCSIMTDGWTDRRSRTLLYFLVSSGGKLLMERHPKIFWTPCAAHCIDLMLEDIGKLVWVKSVVTQAKNLCKFIYSLALVLSTMRQYTNGKELACLGITRFASNFITLKSLLTSRLELRCMFVGPEWSSSSFATSPVGIDATICIYDDEGFWEPCSKIVELPPEDCLAALFVVGFSLSDDGESDEQVALVTNSGTLNRIMIRDIRICGQSARGVRLMRLEEGGKIQSVSILAASEVNTDDTKDLELLESS